ncbi:MAG: DUF2088 domain-containing protein [Pirellulales bacterium]|nr:DUF2088 domain-containing protein [Pirellulales bacterium]
MDDFPLFFRLRQRFDAPEVADVAGEVETQLSRLNLAERVRPGQSVAVAVGSRGIAALGTIVRATVAHLARLGGKPFLTPAMGSHGGATAEGQRRVLESLGVDEATAGCPIRSSMDVVNLGLASEGFPVFFDRHAFEADHVVIVNRVKPHTMFSGPVESGLLKMLLVGLGKHEGARVYHSATRRIGFGRVVASAAEVIRRKTRLLAGLAIVENARERTARIEALLPDEIAAREPALLEMARRWMARLPFKDVDVLLVDRIGKDVSGTGMDANVIGRKSNDHEAAEGETPRVRRIAVRGLTPATAGNALGIGMAEFCRSRVLEQMDREVTRRNVLASGHVAAAMSPLDYKTDRQMLAAAIESLGECADPCAADAGAISVGPRILWIADTLALEELECSAAFLDEARRREDLEALCEPRPLPFDSAGNLPDSVLGWGEGTADERK